MTESARQQQGRIQDSPQRLAILKEVIRHPGLNFHEIRDRLGTSHGTTFYHVKRLEAAGLLRTFRSGRRLLLFPAGASDLSSEVAMVGRILLQSATARRIALEILDKAPLRMGELVEVAGSPRVAYYHVKRFRDAGLVTTQTGFHLGRIGATPLLRKLVTEMSRAEMGIPTTGISHDQSKG